MVVVTLVKKFAAVRVAGHAKDLVGEVADLVVWEQQAFFNDGYH